MQGCSVGLMGFAIQFVVDIGSLDTEHDCLKDYSKLICGSS